MPSNLENVNPISPTTNRLGMSLNIDTGYKAKPNVDASPPHTPISSDRAGRGNARAANKALQLRQATRESLLDDVAPVDYGRDYNKDALRNSTYSRDSHDLSLSPRQITRDSLVDNMLLSLDQFSVFGPASTGDEALLYAAFGDDQPYGTYNPSRNGHGSGLGHSYSYSSDYDNTESTPRLSGARGRRSNSSSNYQSGLGRIDSIRKETSDVVNSIGMTHRGPSVQPRPLHSRSGKGSKGSSTNSFDLGHAQVSATERWTRANKGRSSSFDYGHDRQAMNLEYATDMPSTNPVRYSPYDYDAAPTPTVPVGPRRQRPLSPNAPFSADSVPIQQSTPTLERKRSTRSSKSAYKSRAEIANGLGINFGLNDVDRALPPLPAFSKEPTPTPSATYHKSANLVSGQLAPGQPNASSHTSKDRPGFFRRVFGSSRNNLAAAAASETNGTSYGPSTSFATAPRDRTVSRSQPQVAGHTKTTNASSGDVNTTVKETPHVITKKSSSFFRRRKKSLSEAEHHPPLPVVQPLQLQSEREGFMQDHTRLPSPVSSLRKVMNPYLSNASKGAVETQNTRENSNSRFEEVMSYDADDLRGFSPGYTPDKNATIRTVKHGGAARDVRNSPDLGPDLRHAEGAASDSDNSRHAKNATFLKDSPNNDRESKKLSSFKHSAPNMELSTLHSVSDPVQGNLSRVAVARQPIVESSNKNETLQSPNMAKSSFPTERCEDWIVITPSKPESSKESRVWLEPSPSEEQFLAKAGPKLLAEDTNSLTRTSGSTNTEYKSATSLPLVQLDGGDIHDNAGLEDQISVDEETQIDEEHESEMADVENPTVGDRERARKIYDGNEDFIPKSKAAAWLGEVGAVRQQILHIYLELYDFANLNILAALRVLCGRLTLKAETQQVDRILVAFSRRWCECNPNHGFKAVGACFLAPEASEY